MLIKTIEEIKRYVSIDAGTTFKTIEPFIDEAEELFIKDLISPEMYDDIDLWYNTEPPGDNLKYEALHPYIQRALARYAIFLSINVGGVNIGNAGIQQQSSQNSQPAPQWKVDKLEKSLLLAADRHAEKLLAFLEKNANAFTYELWLNSSSYTINNSLFIKSADELVKYITVTNSRRLYLKLKKYLHDVEELHIKRLVCKNQYEKLKVENAKKEPEPACVDLLNKLKPLEARMALLQALPELRISISDSGINILSYSDGINRKDMATDHQITDLKDSLKEKICAHTEEAKYFLQENIAAYPLYLASPCYTAKPVPGPSHVIQNSTDSKSFSV